EREPRHLAREEGLLGGGGRLALALGRSLVRRERREEREVLLVTRDGRRHVPPLRLALGEREERTGAWIELVALGDVRARALVLAQLHQVHALIEEDLGDGRIAGGRRKRGRQRG